MFPFVEHLKKFCQNLLSESRHIVIFTDKHTDRKALHSPRMLHFFGLLCNMPYMGRECLWLDDNMCKYVTYHVIN